MAVANALSLSTTRTRHTTPSCDQHRQAVDQEASWLVLRRSSTRSFIRMAVAFAGYGRVGESMAHPPPETPSIKHNAHYTTLCAIHGEAPCGGCPTRLGRRADMVPLHVRNGADKGWHWRLCRCRLTLCVSGGHRRECPSGEAHRSRLARLEPRIRPSRTCPSSRKLPP